MFFCFFNLQEAETGLVPSVQDFDKKLAEADAYLQILIDQLKVRNNSLFVKLTVLIVCAIYLEVFGIRGKVDFLHLLE